MILASQSYRTRFSSNPSSISVVDRNLSFLVLHAICILQRIGGNV